MFTLYFLIFLAACVAAGSTGAMFPPGDWYRSLSKPRWTPPNWVFPVAWTLLYLCMSAAGARLALAEGSGLALALWALQIALNTLWTPIFFGLQRVAAGMLVLAALWASVLSCVLVFLQIDTIAAVLFVPYLIWVTVAATLNYAVLKLN